MLPFILLCIFLIAFVIVMLKIILPWYNRRHVQDQELDSSFPPDSSILSINKLDQRLRKIESEIIEIRKFNKDFNCFRPSIEAAFSDISSLKKKSPSPDLNSIHTDLSHLKGIVRQNVESLARHTRILNDVNDIQCKISILPEVEQSIEKMQTAISTLSSINTTVVELLEAEKKNASDIMALTQLVNQLSAKDANENSVSLNSSQIMLAMKAIDMLEGHDFEYFCADLLKKSGYTDVSVTKGSGDQGVDVLATKDGIKYAIQCKCYSYELGNKPIQEVHAGKDIYGCQIGIVLTNNYFTAGAKALANATGVLLWDRNVLERMIVNVS